MENVLRKSDYSPRIIPLEARRFFINIGKNTEGCFCGSISQICNESEFCFCGLDNAILKIDKMLDALGCMQGAAELRSFGDRDEPDLSAVMPDEDKMNTFIIDIIYRQHNSWQGTLIWRNSPEVPLKKNFRSVLELLRLIQSSFEKNNF